jgi:glycosyltransferase involved in cell wall biosynthesis
MNNPAQRCGLMKVSIVVPFYNSEETLGECLESLLNQSHEDKELILVDDQSTDGSPGLAQSATKLPGVRYVRLREKGFEAGARQAGLELATGEIVLQTDSDAVYPPHFIEYMLKEMEGHQGVEQGSILPLGPESMAFKHAFYKRIASYKLKLAGRKKPYGGTMYLTKAREITSYKPMKIGTDTQFVKDLKKYGWHFAYAPDAFFLHHDPHGLLELWGRSIFYYRFCPNGGVFYTLKRLIAITCPWALVFAGERWMQYAVAIDHLDFFGIASIFIGNYLIDMSSVAYFERFFRW